jgi:RimJ/RimL family protein N-acetyltransferase
MQHSFQAENFGIRLRPVRMADAAFIVWLRNLEHAKGRIGDSALDVAAQVAWLQDYFERPDDYYFIIETVGGIRIGTYGFYDFNQGTAETGRWVIRLGVPAAVPSVVIALHLAFDVLKLKAVRARTVASNQPVLSIHRKIGFRQTGVEPSAQIIGGKPVDLVLSVLTAEDGSKARERLLAPARWAEQRIRHWESAHNAELDFTSAPQTLGIDFARILHRKAG